MKQTVVTPDGSVHCPVCNGSQFTLKRTAKAKWGAGIAGALTFGVGGAIAIAAMPKRVFCLGCGENLKTGGPAEAPTPAPLAPAAGGWTKMPATSIRPGDEFDPGNGKTFTAAEIIERGQLRGNKIKTVEGPTFSGNSAYEMKVRRPVT